MENRSNEDNPLPSEMVTPKVAASEAFISYLDELRSASEHELHMGGGPKPNPSPSPSPDPKATKDNKDTSDAQKDNKDNKDLSDKSVQDKSLQDMGPQSATADESGKNVAALELLSARLSRESEILRAARQQPLKHFIAAEQRPDLRLNCLLNEPDMNLEELALLRQALSRAQPL